MSGETKRITDADDRDFTDDNPCCPKCGAIQDMEGDHTDKERVLECDECGATFRAQAEFSVTYRNWLDSGDE